MSSEITRLLSSPLPCEKALARLQAVKTGGFFAKWKEINLRNAAAFYINGRYSGGYSVLRRYGGE